MLVMHLFVRLSMLCHVFVCVGNRCWSSICEIGVSMLVIYLCVRGIDVGHAFVCKGYRC